MVVKAEFCSGKFMAHESLIFILFNEIYRLIIRNWFSFLFQIMINGHFQNSRLDIRNLNDLHKFYLISWKQFSNNNTEFQFSCLEVIRQSFWNKLQKGYQISRARVHEAKTWKLYVNYLSTQITAFVVC